MHNKLSLSQLKVESFVTELKDSSGPAGLANIAGGGSNCTACPPCETEAPLCETVIAIERIG